MGKWPASHGGRAKAMGGTICHLLTTDTIIHTYTNTHTNRNHQITRLFWGHRVVVDSRQCGRRAWRACWWWMGIWCIAYWRYLCVFDYLIVHNVQNVGSWKGKIENAQCLYCIIKFTNVLVMQWTTGWHGNPLIRWPVDASSYSTTTFPALHLVIYQYPCRW